MGAVLDIELYDFFSYHISCVCYINRNSDGVFVCRIFIGDLQVAAGKGSVGEAIAKRICYIHFFCIVVAIAYEYAFTVFNLFTTAEVQVGWIVGELERHCLGKLATGIYFSVKDVCDSGTACLTAEVCFQKAFYIIEPWQLHGGTVVEDDHGIRLYFKDLSNETVLAFRKPHVGTIVSFRFKAVRKSGEDHNLVSGGSSFDRFSCKCVIVEIFVCRKTFCISNLCIGRNGIQCVCDLEAVDMRASAALETRLLCKTTDESDFLGCFQREDLLIVFQKNHRFFGNVACFFMVFFHGEFLRCPVVCIFKNYA